MPVIKGRYSCDETLWLRLQNIISQIVHPFLIMLTRLLTGAPLPQLAAARFLARGE
jgi:hypothetical protein